MRLKRWPERESRGLPSPLSRLLNSSTMDFQYDRARTVCTNAKLLCQRRRSFRLNSLRAWIDQVERTIFFEGRSQEEEDIQGTAGGLGVEREEKPVQGVLLTERWDERIKDTSLKVSRFPAGGLLLWELIRRPSPG